MQDVLPPSKVGTVQRIGMTEVKSYSKHWPCLFPQHGPGMKHTRKIELATWQQVIVERYPGDFARGLFHSDGYRGMNRVRRALADGDHWYEYPRYLFSNESKDIAQRAVGNGPALANECPGCRPSSNVSGMVNDVLMHPQETVDRARALSAKGLFDREVAQLTRIPLRTVRKWRTGQRRSPAAARRKRSCPRCDGVPLDEAAYAYLLGLYLGDGHLVRQRKDVYVLSIACADAWPGLIGAAKGATRDVMPLSAVFARQRKGATEVKSTSKHWPCLFPQHGPGMKHTRRIELATWQQVIVERYPGDFARGLFHSDGYRGMNRVRRALADGDRWYEYPRYLFSNKSLDILGLCGQALDRLEVEWRFARWDMISVAKKGSVARLDEFVGPKY